jgi:hypothetical protein
VVITTNGPWSFDIPEWLSATKSAFGDTLFVTADPNQSGAPEYTGQITVKCGNVTETIQVSLICTQFEVSTTSITLEPQVWLSQVVDVTCNTGWKVYPTSSWLSVDTTGGYKDGSFTVTATTYGGTEPRRGGVIVECANRQINIEVSQNDPEIKVNPGLIYFEPNASLTHPIVVTSNVMGWTATINSEECDWLSFDNEFGYYAYGDGNGNFAVTAKSNDTDKIRTYNITVSTAEESVTLQVSQAPPISASPNVLYFEADKLLEKTVSVAAKGYWSHTTNVKWISFNTVSGNGNGNFDITAEPNRGGMRTGEVTIAGGGTKIIIPISQDAYIAQRLTTFPEYISCDSYASEHLIKITANVFWKVSSNVPWLTVDCPEGSGDATVTILAESNDGDMRQGIITVAGAERSVTIQVEQEATRGIHFENEGLQYYAPDRYGEDVEVEQLSGTGEYSGRVVIPPTVFYSGKTYRVTRIGERAFYKCTDLTSVAIPYTVVDIGDRAFSYCDKLVSVKIPESVTRIGEWAFCACSNLASVEISNSVRKIMNGAFYGCDKLTTVEIPSSVTDVACLSFYACSNLDDIHVYWTSAPRMPNINPDFNDYEHTTLYVPAGTKKSYTLNWYWSSFVNIVERGATGVSDAASEDISAVIENKQLHVNSPAETIYVYSFTGKLLYTSPKASGRITFDLPTLEKLLIVRGSSGWARKVIVNY